MKKLKFVEVEWDDATSACGWRTLKHLPQVQPCVTRGWVMAEDKRQIVLAATLQIGNDEVGDIIAIPKGMVKKMRRLKD